MRQIFTTWSWDERALVAGPLALWIAAYLVWVLILMARKRRLRGPAAAARDLGPAWKITFIAVVAWLIASAIWLTTLR